MERIVQIVDEKYFPNWNTHRIKVELLRDIRDPVDDFVTIIIGLGTMYNVAEDTHITLSAIDIDGKTIFVNRFEDRPLLFRDLFDRRHENILERVFRFLLSSDNHSSSNLKFQMGCQIVVNFYRIPEAIQLQYPEYFERK